MAPAVAAAAGRFFLNLLSCCQFTLCDGRRLKQECVSRADLTFAGLTVSVV